MLPVTQQLRESKREMVGAIALGLEPYNPPINSLVRFRNFNNFAAQMTAHENAQIQAIPTYVTLI